MTSRTLLRSRVRRILVAARKSRILVIGDVMLDQFIWGSVARISPEAPVPIVEFQRESVMPGGAANVARNLSALEAAPSMVSLVGDDEPGRQLRRLLIECDVDCEGLLGQERRPTSVKTRIVAHQQQVVRVDREVRHDADEGETRRLLKFVERRIRDVSAIIIGDYGKGLVTQPLLEGLKSICRARGVWVSMDPKPVHHLDLRGLSLITPNRKEAFELADVEDETRCEDPLQDTCLMRAAEGLLRDLRPAVLLITLGDLGMLLCRKGHKPFHIPTVAQEVFDVSGAGDTVIACFTLAIAAGASPLEAAIVANHAAGVVVGKVGTATVNAAELVNSFPR